MAAGHSIINPYGVAIKVSQRTFDALDRGGYLHKSEFAGLKGMDPKHAALFIEIESGSPWFHEIGADFQGANVVICNCPVCAGEMDYEAPAEKMDRAGRIVSEMNRKRNEEAGRQASRSCWPGGVRS
jgi:hypothetical protein